jgi:hypothetical protein
VGERALHLVGVPDLAAAGKQAVLLPWQLYPTMQRNAEFETELQNAGFTAWSREKVDHELHEIMKRIHSTCVKTADEYGAPGNYVLGANIGGFVKVANAMIDQGLV